VAERAWERIEPLVSDWRIFDKAQRGQLLKMRSAELKEKATSATSAEAQTSAPTGTPKTLLKDLRAYWQGGQTMNALLAKYSNCGSVANVGTAMRGRRSKRGKRAFQLGNSDIDAMRKVIENFYFKKDKRHKLTDTLQELHEKHYSYVDGNGTRLLKPQEECPSYWQLLRFLNDNYPLEVQQRARLGDKVFEKDHSVHVGSVQADCHGVGHIYEIDATICDVFLVSKYNRHVVVSKPTLYLIIDRYSRLIVGWYVGFENASYTAAQLAMLSIGVDKRKLCKSLNIDYDEADWPAHAIWPEEFLADLGELVSRKARRISKSMKCTLTNVPGMRPDWKPLVECGFAMLHQVLDANTPGYAPDSDTRQRRGPKHEKDSLLNIDDFTALIVQAIITHNKSPQVNYKLTEAHLADNVRPIPRELFVHGIQRLMGTLDKVDFDRVREELMPREKGVITDDGIKFGPLHYTSSEPKVQDWLLHARRKRKPLEIAFDHRKVDNIIVYSPTGNGERYVASLVPDCAKFKGLSFAEVELYFWEMAQIIDSGREEKRQAQFKFNQFVQDLTQKARAEKKTQVKPAIAARKASVAAKQAELIAERSQSGGVAVSGQQPPSQATAPDTPSQPSAAVISIKDIRDKVSSAGVDQPAPTAAHGAELPQGMPTPDVGTQAPRTAKAASSSGSSAAVTPLPTPSIADIAKEARERILAGQPLAL